MKADNLTVTLEVKYKITLWEAIKLRISGENFRPIVEEVLKSIRDSFTKGERNEETKIQSL